ncbi:MAG: glycosyltransferase family 2 protein, partial [Candidatus Nanoarchaeia archaeon]
MQKGKLVSVIIPTYNRPNSIIKTLDSLYKQTYRNFEVIVIDDCSKLPYKLKKRKNLRYFRNAKNEGPAVSRNIGVAKANGDIILILDDDIILKKDYVEILVRDLISYKKEKVAAAAGRLLYPNEEIKVANENNLLKISKLTGDIKLNASLDTHKPVFVETLHSCAVIRKE